jgi:hypothetical protein
MKRITLFAAVAMVMVALFSCQKETNSNNPLPTESIKIKTYTEDVRSSIFGTSVTTYNLSYDGNDRLVSLVNSTDPGNRFVWAYPSSSKYTFDLFNNNTLDIHADYFLNSNSQIDSSFQYNSTADSSTDKYVYNAAHQLIKWYEYDYSKVTGSDLWNVTTYTYDGAGNMIKAQDGQTLITYEYYTDKVYVTPQTIPVFVPMEKANLLKKVTITDGIDVGTGTYTYTFDSKDRISTQREDYSNGDVVIKTYTYFD